MAYKPALNQFNGGEISPQLEGRFDWDKYNYSLKVCKNFIPLVEGNLRRRGGTHFVAFTKGTQKVKFKFIITTESTSDIPTLIVNDTNIVLSQQESNSVWESSEIEFTEGDNVLYFVSCEGYQNKTNNFIVALNQENITITLSKSSGSQATVKLIPFNEAVQIKLNGIKTNQFTGVEGDKVVWIASYLGYSASGEITLSGNEIYVLFMKNNTISISKDILLNITSPQSGTLYLPACKIRFEGIGGGGGYYSYANAIYYSGGSGAAIHAILSIPSGIYNYECGKLGTDGYDSGTQKNAESGTETSISLNGSYIAKAEGGGCGYWVNGDGGYGGAGGTFFLDNNYVNQSILATNGDSCNATMGNFDFAGESVYKGYGSGSGYHGTSDNVYIASGTQGALFITFEGE